MSADAAGRARVAGWLDLASRGWHLFPVRPASKVPAVTRWEERASVDPDRLTRFFTTHPDYNAGIACGPSGLLVIDCDVAKGLDPDERTGASELARMAAGRGGVPETWTVSTPSGGRHLYFQTPATPTAGRPVLGNTAGMLGRRLDTRGAGGQVVAPGSRLPGGAYELLDDTDPARLPGWIAHRLSPPPPVPRSERAPVVAGDRGAYVAAAVRAELARVAGAGRGGHNAAVFTAARALGQLVGAGALDRADAEHDLTAAAGHITGGPCDCTPREVAASIRSGLDRGQRRPRRLPPATTTASTATSGTPTSAMFKEHPVTTPEPTTPDPPTAPTAAGRSVTHDRDAPDNDHDESDREERRAVSSLSGLLETWQAWSTSNLFAQAEARSRAAGDTAEADRMREFAARGTVGALDALTAQHEVASLLAGWEWHTVRAARDQGASWSQIAEATRTAPEQARTAYLAKIAQHERVLAGIEGTSFDDAEDWRAAAGDWLTELRPDTPDVVREQIETAASTDDQNTLAALRAAWWNPDHQPATTKQATYQEQPPVQHQAIDDEPDHQAIPDIAADLETVGVETAAQRITTAAPGVDLTTAREQIGAYLAETAAVVGAPMTGWGLDHHDIDAITAAAGRHAADQAVAVPSPRPETTAYPELAAQVAAVHHQATAPTAGTDTTTRSHDDDAVEDADAAADGAGDGRWTR